MHKKKERFVLYAQITSLVYGDQESTVPEEAPVELLDGHTLLCQARQLCPANAAGVVEDPRTIDDSWEFLSIPAYYSL